MRINQVLAGITLLIATFVLSCTPTSNHEPASIQTTAAAENATPNTSGPAPLVVDTSSPLLLDEPTEDSHPAGTATATSAAAENAACFVCHANYRTEFLASRHAQANIGCVNCHGESSAHRNDENNTTAPEKIYSSERIEPFCRKCHQDHDVPPGKVVTRWLERNPDKTNFKQIVCTDCHGDHRMKVRTVIWNKDTGELLRTNKGN